MAHALLMSSIVPTSNYVHDAAMAMPSMPMRLCMQDKLAGDAKNKQIREIYKDLVEECLARPPSAEDANSIAGELTHPSSPLPAYPCLTVLTLMRRLMQSQDHTGMVRPYCGCGNRPRLSRLSQAVRLKYSATRSLHRAVLQVFSMTRCLVQGIC